MSEHEVAWPILTAHATTLCGEPFTRGNGHNAMHPERLADSEHGTLCTPRVFADEGTVFEARDREGSVKLWKIVRREPCVAYCVPWQPVTGAPIFPAQLRLPRHDDADLAYADMITQANIADLLARLRALGPEVDIDAEVDAVWRSGSVAEAVGVRVPYEAGHAVLFFAVLADGDDA